MTKKVLYPTLLVAALIIVIVGLTCWPVKNKNDESRQTPDSNKQRVSTEEHNYPLSTTKTGDAQSQGVVGTLGSHKCMEKFTVERSLSVPAEKLPKTSLELASLQTFRSGAFYGKIKNYSGDDNYQLTELVDKLMQEQKVRTFEHLKADVCLYHRDWLNPTGGGSLNYYIEHYYCTNHCQTGSYGLKVDLNPDGSFVGYRTDFKW